MNVLLKKPYRRKERVRFIRANDPEFNSSFDYASNTISTAKYNVFTFLPKNLFEQFQRIANAYFLVLLILQLIPVISSLTWVTTIIPLVAVLSITALKDLVDDIQRHQSDSLVNNRLSWVIRSGKLVELCWCKVVVGDIIRIENNQFVAADLLLLTTNEQTNLCFIETAELDGETNLKVRNSLPSTAFLRDNIQELSEFNGEIECEPPNNNLNRFTGILRWKNMSYSLSNSHMLLRGCILRNTSWCYGLVVYAGKDTKLMQNSGHTSLKRTSIDRLLNLLIVGIFGVMFVICTLCAIGCGFWESMTGDKFQVYLPWEDFVPGQKYHGASPGDNILGPVVIAALVFLSYVIIINTAVPISLYVSVELIRFSHSWWINWDKKMYHRLTDMPAKARTTLLNEELGQIHYIFTDKTGTLTKNVMVFKKCSINGRSYGHQDQASTNKLKSENTSAKYKEEENDREEACQLEDPDLMKLIEDKDRFVCQFFRLLALCHTVMPEERDGKLIYQAQSPDEYALVMAARKFGFVFLNRQTARVTSETQQERTLNQIEVEVLGQLETYELLAILDFDAFRKRMSVIVRRDGVISLFCKGADSVIYERLDRLSSHIKDITSVHLNHFARSGLRTLCCAVKSLTPTYYKDWSSRYEAAGLLVDNREEMFNELYEEIEQDLVLIGCTAIEDKLQDGVPYAISRLICAGIKIWVLTGDKEETAINVGFGCKLLSESAELIFIDAENEIDVLHQLDLAKAKIKSATKLTDGRNVDDVSWNSLHFGDQPHLAIKQATGFALIINGHSLVYALTRSMKLMFLEVSCLCKTVICCRVTPIQKAQVVYLIKHYKTSITLAVGDGANDVSMIKTAHIGVGISGHEGRQAVLASDYSIAQFRFLERLILVHGRWSYIRMSKFLYYFFYKNFAFTLCHVWYAMFCGYSAQTLYDPFFIALYNLLFTPLPVMALANFEQDVDDENSCLYPKLYLPGIKSSLFNKKIFLCSFIEGILTSLVLFFFPYGAFRHAVKPNGTDISDLQSVGFVVATNLIVIVTLRCALETSYWTFFNHFAIWGSLLFYFCVMFILYSDLFGYEYQGTATHTLGSANFWLTLILTVVTLTVPIIVIKLFICDMYPTLSDTIRLKHKIASVSKKSQKPMLRRTLNPLTWRHSGYAFSHQEGFGKLITTGSMMTFRKSKIGKNVALCGCHSVPVQLKLQQPVAVVLEDPEDARMPLESQITIPCLPSSGCMETVSDFAIGRHGSIPPVPPVMVASEDWNA